MGRNKNNKKNKDPFVKTWHKDLHPETKKSIWAVVLFIAAAVLVLSYIAKAGVLGGYIFSALKFLLGSGYFFAPLSLILIGSSLLFAQKQRVLAATIFGGAIFLLTNLGAFYFLFGQSSGGEIGVLVGAPLYKLLDFWGGMAVLGGLFIVSFLLTFNTPLRRIQKPEEKSKETENATRALKGLFENLKNEAANVLGGAKNKLEEIKTAPSAETQTTLNPVAARATETIAEDNSEEEMPRRRPLRKFIYKKPPLELLQGDRGTPTSGDIKANANIIKRTLENFGIDVEMGEVSVGPTVTQYTLKPAEGVKLSRIVALHNDLSLALAAHPIRIEAPIPGKSLVGIEVPNRSIALVGLRALLENKIFQDTPHPLLFALGRDVAGMPVFADISKMPHLLISGATGSGKSVSIHTIMTSLLYRNPPEVLRFIIVDPKRVELSVYNDIPHLLTPVINDAKKTVQALRWATKEMDRRYDLLSARHARDIAGYNLQAGKNQDDEEKPLPYIVIIIDELADLMAMFPREVESSIIRLAQMARAVGIHLLVATQRPSVEVITGLIKANITSRIAFQVASQIDSRTILDISGAEKLLGNGDMLFLAGDTTKPRRIQGAYISEQEVKRVIEFLREEAEAPEYDEAIFETKIEEDRKDFSEDFSGESDPLYADAKNLVLEAGKASASYLQRRLRVGYARAARLLDLLEAEGIIGPADGAKPREILNSGDWAEENLDEI